MSYFTTSHKPFKKRNTNEYNFVQGEDAGDNGWTHDFVIHVYETQRPGTIPIAAGHADFSEGNFNGDRISVLSNLNIMVIQKG